MSIDADTLAETVRSGGSLAGADLREADPFIMDLSGLDLRDADLSGSHLPHDAGGGRWAGFSDPMRRARRHVRVRNADLSGARLDRILGLRADFRGASLVGASLRSADLREANFELADVRGADFSGSNLDGARFHGSKSDESTVWPDGFGRA